MALKKVKCNIERMFDKSLTDLVRGIRNNKENEARYISQCMEDIKQELRQDNLSVKSNAVAKLTYLQMLGYDISWAGFNIIEVMSSNKFTLKRIGYLAASQSFHCDSELLMLTTNMIRKELNSQNQYEAGLALTSLSCYVSMDLARDLSNDILTLLSSTKPYIRKKAVLMMYKVFLKYPEALRPAFPRLREKLEDPDPGVQSAAVNVVCELARKNPKNYLSLAPIFFKLMTTSTNNWMLIKIIKLFGALTPLEPRLGKKLIEPLTNLIHSTSAMSLLYECINTVIAVLISISSGMPNHAASIQLCVQKLRILIEDSDQNLKYLGLLAMSKILKTHPKSVQAHKDLVLQCLEDKDESIRLRALDLLYGMVSKKNLMEIVKKLMVHMEKAEGTIYRDELLSKIILICSQNNYQFITNFEWYVTVLVELAQMEFGSKQGHVISSQLMDVTIRVEAIRQFAVTEMADLISYYATNNQFTVMQEVLLAAAYLCGEFSSNLKDPERTLRNMLNYKSLPQHIECVFIHNVVKLFSHIAEKYENEGRTEKIIELCDLISVKLNESLKSGELEVQERSSTSLVVLEMVKEEIRAVENGTTSGDLIIENVEEMSLDVQKSRIARDLLQLFAGELNPVAPKAQKKVPVPEGLDLDAWINEPMEDSESDSDKEITENLFVKNEQNEYRKESTELSEEEIKKSKTSRRNEQLHNPHYLKVTDNDKDEFENVPVEELELNVPLKVLNQKRSDKYLKSTSEDKKRKKKGHKKKHKSESSSDEPVNEIPMVKSELELPEGAVLSDSENSVDNIDDPHKALNIDLDIPPYEEPKYTQEKEKKSKSSKKTEREKRSKKSEKRKKKSSKEESSLLILNDEAPVQTKEVKSKDKLLVSLDEGETKNKEKSKKVKKDKQKIKDKESKSKHKKTNLKGYEQPLGISTPSKEFD